MSRRRISRFLCFLMMMMTMMVMGCSTAEDLLFGVHYSVSGVVTDGDAADAPLAGVTINLTGDVTATTTTADTTGAYSFSIPSGSNVTVTPVLAGHTFNPLSGGGPITANQTANFEATAATPGALYYTISGNVSTAGSVLAGVRILLTGDKTGSTVTNALGNFSFPGIAPNGNYTLTPEVTGSYTFSPTSIGVLVSGADSTGNNFTATANVATTYSIEGTVSGTVQSGVTITLSGATFGTAITTTGASGVYTFSGLLPGEYTVMASRAGYTFTPAQTPTIVNADILGQDFTATGTPAHSISGTVTDNGSSAVTFNLTGAATDTTSSSGAYTFTGLAHGAYTVTPVLAGYKFAPSNRAVNITDGSSAGVNFTATATTESIYSICGTVTGEVVEGVTMTLNDAYSSSTKTNASGNYCFSGLVNGAYIVTPTLATYTIVADHEDRTISGANITGVNFVVGTAPTVWSQADLVGTWRMNMLRKGWTDGFGGATPRDEWVRGRFTVDATGRATCVSLSSSTAGYACPAGFDLVFTMNTTTGVITQSGADGAGAGGHMTMTSTKNFAVATATGGYPSYQFSILQKEVAGTDYGADDVQDVEYVDHALMVGANNKWIRSTAPGSTAVTTGAVTLAASLDSSDDVDPGGTITCAMTLDPATGVVTLVDFEGTCGMDTYEGFLSDDKKTIVGTFTDSASTYQLWIIQIVEAGDFPDAPYAMPAGVSTMHMLGVNDTSDGTPNIDFGGWIHSTTTVAPGGVITFSNWASSFGGAAPTGVYTGSIDDTSGTYLIDGNPTFHGQISHDGKFAVGTQTVTSEIGDIKFLNVITK